MSLFCFWTRRSCSHYAAMGEPIPSGSSLETHLAGCAECRAYWSDLTSLTSDLDRLLSVPHASPWLVEPVWERTKPTRSLQPRRMSLAAAGALGLLCGWAVWRLATQTTSPGNPPLIVRGEPQTKAPDEPPTIDPPVHAEVVRPPSTDVGSHVASHRSPVRRNLVWTRERRSRRNALQAAKLHPRHVPLQTVDRRISAANWRASGMVFESRGDAGLANAAYQAAYEDHPTDQSAFDMGRSAEESGDMDQALNAYAALLDAADVRSRSEKGWNP